MEDLLNYYNECFGLIDTIHFNSEVTRSEYEKILGSEKGITIPITHKGIKDNRKIKSFSESGLVCGFIGNGTPYKGFHVLCRAIKDLDITLTVWGGRKKEKGNIHFRGKFSKEQLAKVYQEMDILVVPSICKETFSLVTLEALSYGTPVVVSDNVGAQDIIKEYDSSFVYHTEEDLHCLLEEFANNKQRLIAFNKCIVEKEWKHDINEHAREIIDRIYHK